MAAGGEWSAAIDADYESCTESCTSTDDQQDDWKSVSLKVTATQKSIRTYGGAKSMGQSCVSFFRKFWHDPDTQSFRRRCLADPDRPGLCGPGRWSRPSQKDRDAQKSGNAIQLLARIRNKTRFPDLEYFTHEHVAAINAQKTYPFTLDLKEYRFFLHYECTSDALVVNELEVYQIYTSNATDGQPQDRYC